MRRTARILTLPLAGALALAGVLALAGCMPVEFPDPSRVTAGPTIGVELPLRGDAGADGLRALKGINDEIRANVRPSAVRLNLIVRDTTLGGYANPHQDEGTDASGLPPLAASIVSEFGRDKNVLGAIGGLQEPLASADAAAARASHLPLITLAPLPDDCAAALGRKSSFAGAVSVAGAGSLEALAVARVAKARNYHAIGIMSESGARPRAERAVCFIETIARESGTNGARLAQSSVTGDFATLKRRAAEHKLDAFVYFGPMERGTLVCGKQGVQRLNASSFGTFGHRGYDSSTLPSDCAWVRRILEDREAGRLAASRVVAAARIATGTHGTGTPPVTRLDVMRALQGIPAPMLYGSRPQMMPCAADSADRASFALVPARSWLKAPFVVYDRRCIRDR